MKFSFWLRASGAAALTLIVSACGNSSPVGVADSALSDSPPPAETTLKTCEPAGDAVTEAKLRLLSAGEIGEFIVSFDGQGGPKPAQLKLLTDLGISGLYLSRLPIAGILATRAQAEQLMTMPGVRSVRFNSPLAYDDEAANILSSVTQSEAAPELTNAAGEAITGKGVMVLVNDSGVDGTHLDLQFGSKVVANASGYANLRALAGNLDDGYDEMQPFTPIEGVPNTDVGGSHGSHVAGIVAGDGTASGGRFVGSARGASLAGYGSGAVIFVLDTLGGFDYAMQLLDVHPEYNLRVVTNSFGNPGDVGTCFDPADPTNIATKALSDRGIIVVFSAGNSGSGPDTITGNFKKAPWVMLAADGSKSGLLATTSSRGSLSRDVYQAEMDGETFVIEDRPTVVTPGTTIISARAIAADPFTPLDTEADIASGMIPPELIPFYTLKSGTSMAAPHLAGIIARLLEANPALTWREIKPLLKKTASNMPGYRPWEVGAGFANAEAAVAMAQDLRKDYGQANHLYRGFNAAIDLGDSKVEQQTIAFSPVGPTEEKTFEVGPEIGLVLAQWTQPLGDPCTCAVVLIDPNGDSYGSAIALPELSASVAASAPGMPGTWTLTVRGIGSVSGVSVDPAGVTNGVAGPTTADITLQQFAAGIPRGLGDIANHPAQALIEFAVTERLMDGLAGGFRPDQPLTRGQMAEYLMSWGVRQTRAIGSGQRFADTSGYIAAAADAVTRPGALLSDLALDALPLMSASGSSFAPGAGVTREQMAFALVQVLGRQQTTAIYEGMTMFAEDEDGNLVPVVDADEVTPALRNHVQDALALKILDAEFFMDGEEKKARIHPQGAVSRANYASASVRAYETITFPE
jgi:subtilisin family serine protease